MSLCAVCIRNSWQSRTTTTLCPFRSFHQSRLSVMKNSVQYHMRPLHSVLVNPSGRWRSSNHCRTWSNLSSALTAASEWGTISYFGLSSWFSSTLGDSSQLFSEMNAVIGGVLVSIGTRFGWGLMIWMKPLTSSIQSLKSSSGSGSSPSCGLCLDNPSGLWCVAGTWTSSKWNISIETIHLLILAEGMMSRFLSIPLINFASTSTIKIWMLIRYNLSCGRAQYRP